MKVDFYHLTATPLDRVLPQIAEKVVGGGDRLLVVTGNDEQAGQIDRLLWAYKPDAFLPHARIGMGDDSAQPILIAPDVNAANRARHIALIDGEWRDGALDFDRAFHFFDDETVRAARLTWKALGDREGVERRYWKQNDAGRWEQVV